MSQGPQIAKDIERIVSEQSSIYGKSVVLSKILLIPELEISNTGKVLNVGQRPLEALQRVVSELSEISPEAFRLVSPWVESKYREIIFD